MKRLLDYDPINGVSCWFEYNDFDKRVTLTHEQDVSAILDRNKAMANDDDKSKRGIIEWMNKFGVDLNNPDHKQKVFELLNHPDYRYLKTTSLMHTVKTG
jgi:hypothetical protein